MSEDAVHAILVETTNRHPRGNPWIITDQANYLIACRALELLKEFTGTLQHRASRAVKEAEIELLLGTL